MYCPFNGGYQNIGKMSYQCNSTKNTSHRNTFTKQLSDTCPTPSAHSLLLRTAFSL